jgi:membrane protease YdiL (CAAX protease family)
MTTLPKKSLASLFGVIWVYMLLLLITCFWTPFLLAVSHLPQINGWLLFQSRILIWGVLSLLYLYATRVEKKPFLAWKDKKYKLVFYICSVFILIVTIIVMALLLKMLLVSLGYRQEFSRKLHDYAELFKTNTTLLIFTALTAGVTEELIFRGYIQTRLEKAFNNPIAGIVVSAILFSSLHASYGTLTQLLNPLLIGLLFSLYYWRYRNIKVLIVSHFLFDILSLLAMTLVPTKG